MDALKIVIDGRSYSVIGGEFWEMLEKVKTLPGRKYLEKVWHLPLSLDEAKETLSPLQIVDEDGLLEAEIADIRRVQAHLLELCPKIEAWTKKLDEEVKGYSYGSKSRIKYGKARKSAMLSYALEYASLPIEKLTEPQIKTLYAALRDVEEA